MGFLTALILLSNCATPPDVPVCTELIPNKKAYCTFTISDKEFMLDNSTNLYPISKKTLTQIKTESLLVPATSYAEIKGYILKACKKHNDCKGDIGKWQRKMLKLEKINEAKRLAQ